jgi:hypothetical protein
MTVYLENQLKISYKIREFSQLARNESNTINKSTAGKRGQWFHTSVCTHTKSLYATKIEDKTKDLMKNMTNIKMYNKIYMDIWFS